LASRLSIINRKSQSRFGWRSWERSLKWHFPSIFKSTQLDRLKLQHISHKITKWKIPVKLF